MPTGPLRSGAESNPWTLILMLRSIEPSSGAMDPTYPILDAEVRVVIVVEPTRYVAVFGGLTGPETVALTALLEQLDEDV